MNPYLEQNRYADRTPLLPIFSGTEPELRGFEYLPLTSGKLPTFEWFVSSIVKTPSGEVYTMRDILNLLEEPKFGNKKQIEALKAWEFFYLAENHLIENDS